MKSKVGARLAPVPLGTPLEEPRTEPPTVLVVGTDDWAIEQSATELEAGGCRVLRCHESRHHTPTRSASAAGGVEQFRHPKVTLNAFGVRLFQG